jgi:uncharacterized protein involved in exopolysaccharide biosynthesis
MSVTRNERGQEMAASRLEVDDLDEEGGRDRRPTPADWALFVLRSALRHRGLASAVFVGCVAILVTYYFRKTPQYRVETTILTQRQQELPSMMRSNVAEDSPTRSAPELILRRENLIELIKDANLTESGSPEAPLEDLLDRMLHRLSRLQGPELAEDDPLEKYVRALDRKLKVSTVAGTINIQIDWPNPRQAFRLVEGSLQNFLEARHVQEVTTLDEAISLLQGRAAVARAELTKVVEEARRSAMQDPGRVSRSPAAAAYAGLPAPPSAEAARLRSILAAKERAIADVEEFRRRRLADLQAQYDARRAIYSEKHPEIATLRQDIEALSRESPQIAGLREEERALRREYEALFTREGAAPSPAAPSAAAPRLSLEGVSATVEQNERVREARFRYQQMIDRVSSAQVELDTARAAFKHRYTVIWPARMPTRPVSPSPRKVFGLGGIAALLLTFMASAAVDVRRGRVLERWQVERTLGLPIMADFKRR